MKSSLEHCHQFNLKLKHSTSQPNHFREIFRKSSHHVDTNKGSVVKQSGNDVEGCRSQKVLFQPNIHIILKYSVDDFLHCIAEIRAYWVEPKPFQIDNPRHHYHLLDNAAFVCVHVVGRFSKDFSEVREQRSQGFQL